MYKVRTLNQISALGLARLPADSYQVGADIQDADALLLRSHVLAPQDLNHSIKAIARAGAGVNNIPVDACTEQGICVFNTPGANANAVKELVLCALLLCSRGILQGNRFVSEQADLQDHKAMASLMEKEKKRFKGTEIKGKVLGVVGLGAIGSLVAEMGLMLGMDVIGYDPALSVEAAWRLPSEVKRMENLNSLLAKSDFVSLHLPVFESTRNMINDESLAFLKSGASLLNFAREQIVDTSAVVRSLEAGKMRYYAADFPMPELISRPDCLLFPHLGASTAEAEDNCAIMAADQLMDFLENGNIKNSVNFPATFLERSGGYRLSISNHNVPKVLGKVLGIFADENINVIDMINKSRNEIAYNLLDVEVLPTDAVIEKINAIDGVINVRLIPS